MRLPLSIVSYGPSVTNWCCLPYPNHPDGCGNYLDKDWCPPAAPLFPHGLDISNYDTIRGHNDEMFLLKLKNNKEPTMWLFIRKFDLGSFARNLQEKHPSRSDKQARIPYLWHTKIYEKVYAEAQEYRWKVNKPTILLKRPEANGVNLFATCRVNGGPQLEKNPQETVYMMAILALANSARG